MRYLYFFFRDFASETTTTRNRGLFPAAHAVARPQRVLICSGGFNASEEINVAVSLLSLDIMATETESRHAGERDVTISCVYVCVRGSFGERSFEKQADFTRAYYVRNTRKESILYTGGNINARHTRKFEQESTEKALNYRVSHSNSLNN